MCGVVAIARPGGLFDDERGATLLRMRDRLAHRGPDDATSAVIDEWVALGHRRLSIIDRAGSRQPLFDERGTVGCIFNGEIYNFVELRARLRALGHRFATSGDGEVIVHGYEQWGDDIATRLQGMFAFVLVDRARRRVVVARDPAGIKPLFWSWRGGALFVASELKALVEHPALPRVADRLALAIGAIRLHVPWPLTAFAGIHRLPPGALLTLTDGGAPALTRYAPMLRAGTPAPAPSLAAVLERLERAVARQMVADVPVGAFLSGGIDSTLVVTLMRRLTEAPLHTFSVHTGPGDESAAAAATARRLGTAHHAVALDELPFEALTELPLLCDEPYAETSALGVRALSRAAREHVAVALSGDGGDELFGGYDSYRWIANVARAGALLPTRLAPAARGWASAALPARRWPTPLRRALRAVSLWGESPRVAQHLLATQLGEAPAGAALSSLELTGLIEAAVAPELDELTPLRQAMAADRLERLPGEMLSKVDVASMSASLEVRVPLLDPELAALADALPDDALAGPRYGKLLLRRALAALTPGPLAWAPKRGFSVPSDHWLRRPAIRPRLSALMAQHRARVAHLTGVDPVAALARFLVSPPAEAQPAEILWLASVALWAERFGVDDAIATPIDPALVV